MKYGNPNKWVAILSSFFVVAICGASLLAVNKSNSVIIPAGTIVILQADGVAPPPPPPMPKPVAGDPTGGTFV